MTCKSQGHPFVVISLRSSPLSPSPAGDADALGYPTLVRCALSASSQTYTVFVLSSGTAAWARYGENAENWGQCMLDDDEESRSRWAASSVMWTRACCVGG